jgi:hypothetical protein
MVRSLGLVAIAFICSIGIAAAQQVPTSPVSPEVLGNLVSKIRPAPANGPMSTAQPAVPTNAGGASTNSPGNLVVGFNFVHATNCEWFTDGTNNFLFLLPQEGGFFATENNLFTAQTFLTGCVNGDFVGVNVTDSSTGNFNAVLTFPFK